MRGQASLLIIIALTLSHIASAAAPTDDALGRAEELVDGYYGDSAQLRVAADLVSKTLSGEPSARAYTLAARIVMKSGHIELVEFRPGTKDLYRQLIGRALALDPRYVPALSLMSESDLLGGDIRGACEAAQRGVQVDPNDPWIHLDLSRCYARLGDRGLEFEQRNIAARAGPGSTQRQRRAYVAAMEDEVRAIATPANVGSMRESAAQAEAAMDPRDAWTLGSLAEDFELVADYDDAAIYARKALHVMDYPAGHSILAAAMYGKAAQLKLAHQKYAETLKQAQAAGGPPDLIIGEFDWARAPQEVARLAPTVRELMNRH